MTTEFIYQVFVNDNNPKTAGIYIRKVIQEKIDPMTDIPYLYQIDATIPFGQGFSSDWIDRKRLGVLQSWGPNNSSHQWLTTDEGAALNGFTRLVDKAQKILSERIEADQNAYHAFADKKVEMIKKFKEVDEV